MIRATFVAMLTMTLALAGCADDAPAPAGETIDTESFQLQAGTGAIAGLLVDDRFRPIDLEDSAATEFQARGFILLQETGERVQTTENGEFSFVNLQPGPYTLRVNAEGHEATPYTIQVDAGAFSDASIVARRVISAGGTILTQEYTIFIDCWTPVWTELNCFLDMSLDSKRGGFLTDYTTNSAITYMKSEFLFDKPGGYDGSVGICEGESFTENWAAKSTDGTDYTALLMTTDAAEWEGKPEDSALNGWLDTSRIFCTVAWPDGQAAGLGVPLGDWIGFGIGMKAQVVQSVFLGAPEVDLIAYCTLC